MSKVPQFEFVWMMLDVGCWMLDVGGWLVIQID
jgi:hypothetical protein